jgi:hypothetical protein
MCFVRTTDTLLWATKEMTELQISQIKETVKQNEQNGGYTLTGRDLTELKRRNNTDLRRAGKFGKASEMMWTVATIL